MPLYTLTNTKFTIDRSSHRQRQRHYQCHCRPVQLALRVLLVFWLLAAFRRAARGAAATTTKEWPDDQENNKPYQERTYIDPVVGSLCGYHFQSCTRTSIDSEAYQFVAE